MTKRDASLHLGQVAVPATELDEQEPIKDSHHSENREKNSEQKEHHSKKETKKESKSEGDDKKSEPNLAEGADASPAEKSQAKEELSKVVGRSHEAICIAKTVFPFDLFPDTIIVDRNKITVVNRIFFFVANIVSIKLEDILNVTSSIGPFFGSVDIHTRFFETGKPYQVNFLWRKDALRIDRILQGYSIAREEHVDMSSLDTKELGKMLDELGRTMQAKQV